MEAYCDFLGNVSVNASQLVWCQIVYDWPLDKNQSGLSPGMILPRCCFSYHVTSHLSHTLLKIELWYLMRVILVMLFLHLQDLNIIDKCISYKRSFFCCYGRKTEPFTDYSLFMTLKICFTLNLIFSQLPNKQAHTTTLQIHF